MNSIVHHSVACGFHVVSINSDACKYWRQWLVLIMLGCSIGTFINRYSIISLPPLCMYNCKLIWEYPSVCGDTFFFKGQNSTFLNNNIIYFH